MFKKIVVGMDGSDRADHAFDTAVELARASGASVTIAHIDEQTIGKGGGHIRVDEPEIAAALKEKTARLAESGVDADLRVSRLVLSSAGAMIAGIASQVEADLIVVGTRGHSGMAGTLLGSVAHKLLGVAHVPVLVIPDPAQQPVQLEAESSAANAG
ncbi:MAG: universal stress protein [Actinomycetota bacterium]|nr:universal stress protein [Actinomycetota bacterium]